MSFNQRPEYQNLSEQTSNSQASGNEALTNGHDSDYQDPSIQNSSTQTPTTRQPPTLPGITVTSGVPSHPDPVNLGPHYPLNDNDIQAFHNWAQRHSNPFGHYPWNNNSARAPPNPHPAFTLDTIHPAAAGYFPSTFTPGPVSARMQELMNGSTPIEICGQQSGMPNPLNAVGECKSAYRHWLIKKVKYSTARRQARTSNTQTDMSQRRRTRPDLRQQI